MSKIFIVYEGDAWLSSSSLEVKGAFETREDAAQAIAQHHKIPISEFLEDFTSAEILEMSQEEKEEIARTAVTEQLDNIGQTQGYSVNYHIEEVELNLWGK